MKSLIRTAVFVFVLFSGQALAEVKDAGVGGFTVVNEVIIEADVEAVWKAAIDDVGLWWSSDHTVSGEAHRLSITALPQGCFCENLGPGAGVVHLTVTMGHRGDVHLRGWRLSARRSRFNRCTCRLCTRRGACPTKSAG